MRETIALIVLYWATYEFTQLVRFSNAFVRHFCRGFKRGARAEYRALVEAR